MNTKLQVAFITVAICILLLLFIFAPFDNGNSTEMTNNSTDNRTDNISPLSFVSQSSSIIGYYNGEKTIMSDTTKNLSDYALSVGLINDTTDGLIKSTKLNKYTNSIDSIAIYREFNGSSEDITEIEDLNIIIKSDANQSEIISILNSMYSITVTSNNGLTQLKVTEDGKELTSYYKQYNIQNNNFHILSSSASELSSITQRHSKSDDGIKMSNLSLRILDIQNTEILSSLVSGRSVTIDSATYTKENQTTNISLSLQNKEIAESVSRQINLAVSFLSLGITAEYNIDSNPFELTDVNREGKTVNISYTGDYASLYNAISTGIVNDYINQSI